ncbi:hypothetical protein AHAS_Ahas05G0091300 [Arachis hypogaea]
MEPQPTINNVLQSKKIMKKCDIAIARWMVDASMPFNAINLAYYQLMIDATVNMGAGYECLNFDRICGYLLSKLVVNVKKMIEHYLDASYASKIDDLLFKIFKDIALFVGPKNVVHIVTNNAANC